MMRRNIQAIIDKGNLSPGLEQKIEQYKIFEQRYLSGEGDVIFGLKGLDKYEDEIIAMSKNILSD